MNTVLKSQKDIAQKPDRVEMEAFLLKNLIWSSEVIFTLEEEADNIAEWHIVKHRDRIQAAMMQCPDYRPVPLFFAGTAGGAEPLLDLASRHKSVFVECPLDFVALLKKAYIFPATRIMARMALKRNVPFSTQVDRRPRPLGQDDLKKAFDLYEKVVGNAKGFDAMQFIRGMYFGVEVDGDLVSMAGTQTISPKYGTATVGNVITDAEHRGKGYALACVYFLSKELRKSYKCVTINVNRGNKAAVHIYRRCGFVKQLEYFEGEGIK